jgi:hypothetical protein
MPYFYRYRSTFGTWLPAKSNHKPNTKGPEGEKRKVKDITEIPPEMAGFTLTDLDRAIASND